VFPRHFAVQAGAARHGALLYEFGFQKNIWLVVFSWPNPSIDGTVLQKMKKLWVGVAAT
jgi:hypothetical protein